MRMAQLLPNHLEQSLKLVLINLALLLIFLDNLFRGGQPAFMLPASKTNQLFLLFFAAHLPHD
jgi:hypothetical protein